MQVVGDGHPGPPESSTSGMSMGDYAEMHHESVQMGQGSWESSNTSEHAGPSYHTQSGDSRPHVDATGLSGAAGAMAEMAQPQQQPNWHPTNREYQALRHRLDPIVRHVLRSVLENDNEESVTKILEILLQPGSNDISKCVDQPMVLQAKVLEALADFMKDKAGVVDGVVPVEQLLGQLNTSEVKTRLSLTAHNTPQANHMCSVAEFFYFLFVELAGPDAAVLASAIASTLLHSVTLQELVGRLDHTASLLADIVCKIEQLEAKVTQVAMTMYSQCSYMKADDLKQRLMSHYQYYTVDTLTGTVNVHETSKDYDFQQSPFRLNLVDSYGKLMRLLQYLEDCCNVHPAHSYPNKETHVLAVDFEGVKLCRSGPLCLVQLTCSHDPTLVYVLDVHKLGRRIFTVQTLLGTSVKSLLENDQVTKIWFDPRNDVDALYHQFGIFPKGIFDLQLAEVAHRRSRQLQVKYVQSLQKCLGQCGALSSEQKMFAENINQLGKRLFEPSWGGDYSVFQSRPLNACILIYAAHDARHMLALYEQYTESLREFPQQEWIQRVLQQSEIRSRHCLSEEYVNPSSEAPDF